MGVSSLPGGFISLQKGLTYLSNKGDLLHVFPAAQLPQDFFNSLCGNKKEVLDNLYVSHYTGSELLGCI